MAENMSMHMPMMPDDTEESSEGDAMQAAFDSIRAAVDDAEKEMMVGRMRPEEPELPEEGE